jgi:hypothetical protein
VATLDYRKSPDLAVFLTDIQRVAIGDPSRSRLEPPPA